MQEMTIREIYKLVCFIKHENRQTYEELMNKFARDEK